MSITKQSRTCEFIKLSSRHCDLVWLPLTTWTSRRPAQALVFAAGDDRVLKMRNYGTGLTPVVAVRQQTDHRSLAPSNISPYRPPRLPLDILHLIFNFCSVFDLLTCRLVCPLCRRYNLLNELTLADFRCAGPSTTSSPTISSSFIRPLSSMNARSTVRSPPSLRTTSSAACVGKAPHGVVRLPQVLKLSSPLPAPTRYTSSTAASSPSATSSLIRAPNSIF